MKLIASALIALALTGCATMENFCDGHPRTCVLGTTAVVVVATSVVLVETTKHNTIQNPQNPKQ
jgi:hypothetical protein